MNRIVSKKIQRSARGQDCTMNVAGVCNYNSDTTVLAHINVDGGKMGGKTHDISACYCCSDCHSWLDQYLGTEEDRLFYTRRALVRTMLKLIELGIVVIK